MSKQNFNFLVPHSLLVVIQRLQRAGHRVVIVGGAPRDFLLHQHFTDYDLASDALPQQVQKLFRRCRPTGLKHGTVTILQGNESYEITTFRRDGIYKNARHPESVAFTGDLAGDLARRDFSINALAFEPYDTSVLAAASKTNSGKRIWLRGQLHDCHNGRADLERRQIRAIGQPQQRFAEDALRMLRACRLSAKLNFAIEPTTLEAILSLAHRLGQVSWPRVQDELRKLLCARFVPQGLRYLQQSGLWPQVLPHLPLENTFRDARETKEEVCELFARAWGYWQAKDSWPNQLLQIASKRGLQQCLRAQLSWNKEKLPLFSFVWALLFLTWQNSAGQATANSGNDLSRQAMQKLEQLLQVGSAAPALHRTLGDNQALYRRAEQNLTELNCSNREKSGALGLLAHSGLVGGGQKTLELLCAEQAYIRALLALFAPACRLPAVYLLGLSSQAAGAPKESWLRFCDHLLDVIAQRPALSVAELAADGKTLLARVGIAPGPQMGRLLHHLLGHVLRQPQNNNATALEQLARQYLARELNRASEPSAKTEAKPDKQPVTKPSDTSTVVRGITSEAKR